MFVPSDFGGNIMIRTKTSNIHIVLKTDKNEK